MAFGSQDSDLAVNYTGGALVVWPETLSRTPWLINKLAGGPPFYKINLLPGRVVWDGFLLLFITA